jgi:phenylalanyl-tRNA synthetase beta chain
LPTRDRGADLEVEVPSFRRDLAMEDDLVEELIRVWGYDKIPTTLPGGAIEVVTHPPTLRQAQTVRQALVGAGLLEPGAPPKTRKRLLAIGWRKP